MDKNGNISECKAKPGNVGQGRCTHFLGHMDGKDLKSAQKAAEQVNEVIAKIDKLPNFFRTVEEPSRSELVYNDVVSQLHCQYHQLQCALRENNVKASEIENEATMLNASIEHAQNLAKIVENEQQQELNEWREENGAKDGEELYDLFPYWADITKLQAEVCSGRRHCRARNGHAAAKDEVELKTKMLAVKEKMAADKEVELKKEEQKKINKLLKNTAKNNIYLDVPFAEKDDVKALGARWNPKRKRWYATETNKQALKKWISANQPDRAAEKREAELTAMVGTDTKAWFDSIRNNKAKTRWTSTFESPEETLKGFTQSMDRYTVDCPLLAYNQFEGGPVMGLSGVSIKEFKKEPGEDSGHNWTETIKSKEKVPAIVLEFCEGDTSMTIGELQGEIHRLASKHNLNSDTPVLASDGGDWEFELENSLDDTNEAQLSEFGWDPADAKALFKKLPKGTDVPVIVLGD